ncbi:MAG: DUF6152 family protein [Gammaproteobacteria bacterium]|nr:DUF6152 family protein [Gammaproteobacteria bacterium]
MKYYAYAMCLAVCGAADAHHGPGQFDRSQPMEVTGVVTDIRFVNPHGYVYFDVTDANGALVPWRCELQAGSLLRRSGWTEDLFGIGGTITVTGDQGRREEHACALRSVILADGSVLDRYGQRREVVAPPTRPLRLADGQLNLAGAWAAVQRRPAGGTGLDDAGPGRGPEMIPGPDFELTAAGRKAIEGVSHQVDNPRFYCMPVNIFFDWTFDRHINEIIQTEETITLKYGFMDIVRTIHMNLEEHPVDITPTRAGHSIGRWEEDVLVVDTIGFAEGFIVVGREGVVKHSNALHSVERFSYDAATQALNRSHVVEDPLYFNGQFTGQRAVYLSDVPFDPYDCVELKDEDLRD